ncbi:hypothetical protein CP533_6589 [Ophiocordyceps camponoti-saundersi (nom. inval.)]|nr:hypothetical protein CP533_6589 [Ophiocordyceps camponoti-saundersi (nom. inval.)]
MRVAFSIAALVATVFAQDPNFNPIYKPTQDEVVPAGSVYPITWKAISHNGPEDKINIVLLAGKDQNSLDPVETIASGVVNNLNKYDWKVGSNLGKHATYGIRMDLVSNPKVTFQYSMRFKIANSAANEIDTGAAPSYSQGGKTIATTSAKPETSQASAPAVYAPTKAVSEPYAPAASVDCGDKHAVGALAKPTGLSAVPKSSNSTLLSSTGKKSNSTGIPIQATAGAALLHTSLFGLCGGLLALTFVL